MIGIEVPRELGARIIDTISNAISHLSLTGLGWHPGTQIHFTIGKYKIIYVCERVSIKENKLRFRELQCEAISVYSLLEEISSNDFLVNFSDSQYTLDEALMIFTLHMPDDKAVPVITRHDP
jgi:hypothetical protein